MGVFFSVIVPVFNREATVERCITSVLNQSFAELELLLIDDGSTDNSIDTIHRFINIDPRVKFFPRPSNRQKGANACRNIGVEKAEGSFVSFLDSDDQWSPDRLMHAYEFVVKNDPEAVYSGALIDDGRKRTPRKSKQIKIGASPADFILSPDNFAQTSTLLVKKEIALEIKFDESLRRNQDYDFFIRLGLKYHWTYLDSPQDVIVYWLINEKRNLSFDSNIRFYKTHEGRIRDKNIAVRFLYNNWLAARKEGSQYKKTFKSMMVRQFWDVDIVHKLKIIFSELLYQYYTARGKI